MGPKTNNFNELSNENDLEEKVIHNTYLNGLNNKADTRYSNDNEKKISNPASKRICWADNNNFNRKDLLCNTNYTKDLFYQKEIKPILSHKKGKPIKSILKKRSASADGSASKYKMFGLNNVTASTNLNNSNINNQNAYSASNNYNSNLNNNYGTNNSFIINNNETKSPIIDNNNNNSGSMNVSNNSIMNNYVNNKNIGSSILNKPLGQINNYSSLNQTGVSNPNSGLISNSNSGNNNNNNNNKENSNFNSRLNNNNMNNTNPGTVPRQNYFSNNNQNNSNSNNAQQRSYSVDQKNENSNNRNNQSNNNYASNSNQGEMTKIIITPNIHSIYNHNINNYYIQSANDINLEKLRENTSTTPSGLAISNLNFDSNNSHKLNERPSSVNKKDSSSISNSNNISPLNAQGNNFNYNNTSLLKSQNQLNTNNLQGNYANNNNKLVKSLDNQRLLQNNFLNQNSFIE